jgi:hypothetical protein
MCEACEEGYVKQNDRCVQCTGSAFGSILAQIVIKVAMSMLLNAKLIDKATTRTYTTTTAFATVVFAFQTASLALSDSYGTLLRTEAPVIASFIDQFQSVLSPDKQVGLRLQNGLTSEQTHHLP